MSSVDAADRHGAAAAHDVDGGEQGGEAVDAGLLHQRVGDGAGEQADQVVGQLPGPRAVGPMPTASMTESGPDHRVPMGEANPRSPLLEAGQEGGPG